MIVRVGFLDKDENYIARLANYYSAHANETVQFEIYLFTKEEALRKQLSRGGRMDLLVAEEDLLPEPEEYSRNMELAFWSTEKHEQKRNGYPVVFRYQKASEIFREFQSMAAKRGHGASSFEMQANGQVVLFINGAGGAGSGTAAAGCAAAMAAQGKNTVCFTLKQNACNDSFDICGSSMTDVMYEISMWRQLGGKDQGQLQMKLQSMLKQDNETEVYSFAPFDLPVSAMNFDAESVENLIQAIKGICERCVISADGTLSPMLLKLIRLADWTVIVSDSTAEGNEKSSKLLDSLEACVPTLSSSYWSTSRCTADRAAWAAYISRFCALLNRLSSSGVSSALPNRRCWAFSAVFSASVFSFFFLGTDCSTLAFFGGERVFLADDSSLRFSFGLLISVCPPRSR